MSVHVYTQLRAGVDPNQANQVLATFFDDGKHQDYRQVRFITDDDTQDWLDDINRNPKSPQRHLKPKGRQLKLDELKAMFPLWCVSGLSHVDIGFRRTSEDTMQRYLAFVQSHRDLIHESSGVREMVERSGAEDQFADVLFLDSHSDHACYELPDDQQEPVAFDGICTVRGMDEAEYVVAYGQVDGARFKKRRTHIHPDNDPIHVNEKGQPVLLIQSIGIGEHSNENVEYAYDRASELGMREDFRYFAAAVYKMQLCPAGKADMSVPDALRLIEWAKAYTRQHIKSLDYRGIHFRGVNARHIPQQGVAVGGTVSERHAWDLVRNWVYFGGKCLLARGWKKGAINGLLRSGLDS